MKPVYEPCPLSFEVFPPKTDAGYEKLCGEGGVLERLYALNPGYISVTYGVGGANAGRNMDVVRAIHESGRCEAMTHYTCIGRDAETAETNLALYRDMGIKRLLALRGDKPADWTENTPGMRYATELVALLADKFPDTFLTAVSGNPEGHVECISVEDDIAHLKEKQDMGADYVLTQLCWDMDQFQRWLEAVRKAGVTLPIEVGMMPVTAITGVLTQSLSHNACVMDKSLCEIITKYWLNPNPYAPEDPEAEQKRRDFRLAGLDYSVKQIEKYRACGIDCFHIFAMNKYDDAAYVAANAGLA